MPAKQVPHKGQGCLYIIVLIVFVSFCISFCDKEQNQSNKQNEPESPDLSEAIVRQSKWDGSVRQVTHYLEENLKDPDSYQSIDWSTLNDNGGNGRFRYMVRHKYRAKNSFGGYDIANQIFYLDAYGTIVDIKNLD